jgi:hypothetical protein
MTELNYEKAESLLDSCNIIPNTNLENALHLPVDHTKNTDIETT